MATWRGRRVMIVGLARQGKALARYFAKEGAEIVVTDLRRKDELREAIAEVADLPIEYALGAHPASLADGIDLLCLSGGVPADLPLAQQARARRIPVTNDSQLFLEACPAPVIGVTGSAGKTTTVALLGAMAQRSARSAGGRAWVGGNIGRPLLSDLDQVSTDDRVVMELSSFQLELMTASPTIAVVLNVTPNHLDRHRTLTAYTAAKARILDFQGRQDTAVLGADDPGAWALRDRVRGRLVGFGISLPPSIAGATIDSEAVVFRAGGPPRRLFETSSIRLRGDHNLKNVLAACAAAAAAGISDADIAEAVSAFEGVAHRLSFVRSVAGAAWYDDSIATTPERSMAAVRAFQEPLVLLAGGRDKDLDWSGFAEVVHRRVDHLVLFGEAAEKIAAAVGSIRPGDRLETIERSAGLEGAVHLAAQRAKAGDVVLLAPGGTSFDEFTDFAERGDKFATWVRDL